MKKSFILLLSFLTNSFLFGQSAEVGTTLSGGKLFIKGSPDASELTRDAQSSLQKADRQFFIENKGQWPSEVLFMTRINGLDAWITKNGIVYDFYKMRKRNNTQTEKQNIQVPGKFDPANQGESERYGQVMRMTLQNANPTPSSEGIEKSVAYYNYFLGNDLSKWASNVALYKEALVKNVYIGIDARYYFEEGKLRYDYIVQPGANADRVKMIFEGVDKTNINQAGELVFTTRFGKVKQVGLYSYQENNGNKEEVASRFEKDSKGKISFEIGDYDKEKPLFIDPLLYSTYIGGTAGEEGRSIAIDGSGNAYITGYTESTGYPTTPGAYDQLLSGADVFVTKLNSSGTGLLYSTFIGGATGQNRGFSIAIDVSGNAYITGLTKATDYPTTSGAFDEIQNDAGGLGGDGDVFVTKLNNSGNALIYSTFIGGLAYELGYSIALDASGNSYITGYTYSTNFPTTAGALDQTINGQADVFVTKINSTGTALFYSTFIGGADTDIGYSIAIDASGNAYVTGGAGSSNFPTSVGAYDITPNGNYDVFVTMVNGSGSALIYSTLIGGAGEDQSYSIAIDGSGNAYITGFTSSSGFPTTVGAYDQVWNNTDVFVTKLNSSGTALLYSTFIGGGWVDYGFSIAIDGSGSAYITGYTQSDVFNPPDFPTTAGSYDQTWNGDWDVFVTKLNSGGSALLYSTFIGGNGRDIGTSIAIDGSGNAYITGWTYLSDYPTTAGAYNELFIGNVDVFVTKLGLSTAVTINVSPSSNSPVCAGNILNLSVSASGGTLPYSYSWSGPNGFTSTLQNPSIAGVTTAASGIYSITITDANANTGNASTTVTVNSLPVASITASLPACITGCVTLTASGGVSYLWSTGSTSSSIISCTAGTFTVTVTDANSCSSNAQITLSSPVLCPVPTNPVTSLITGSTAQLNWETNTCAISYNVQYRKVGTTNWTSKNTSGNIGFLDIKGLKKGLTYEWQVRTKCSNNPGAVYSAFTSLVTFTTSSSLARSGEATTEEETSKITPTALVVYPNPASQQISLNVSGYEGKWNLKVVNVLGQQVIFHTVELKGRQTYSINISALAQGIYKVILFNDSGVITGTFMKG
ncbi:MAG: SBBP repeat-containing protein [Chitinophagaceae bacterium]